MLLSWLSRSLRKPFPPASTSRLFSSTVKVVTSFNPKQRFRQALLSPIPSPAGLHHEDIQKYVIQLATAGLGPSLVRQQSRDDAVANLSQVVDQLCVREGAWMSNAACRMLLGAPGLGKSRILQVLAYASAQKHRNLVPVYVDCTSLHEQTPSITSLMARAESKTNGGNRRHPKDSG